MSQTPTTTTTTTTTKWILVPSEQALTVKKRLSSVKPRLRGIAIILANLGDYFSDANAIYFIIMYLNCFTDISKLISIIKILNVDFSKKVF